MKIKNVNAKERTVAVPCTNSPNCLAVCDGIVQHLGHDPKSGELTHWSPDPISVLIACGWVKAPDKDKAEHWFCGHHCEKQWAYAEKRGDHNQHGLPVVERITDRNYAAKAYAQPVQPTVAPPEQLASNWQKSLPAFDSK